MTASKVFLDQPNPNTVTMEGTASASAMFFKENPTGQAFLISLATLGITPRELPESQRAYQGLELEGDTQEVVRRLPYFNDRRDVIVEVTGVGTRPGCSGLKIMKESVDALRCVPAGAPLMRYVGALSSSFAEELAPDDGCIYMFGRSGADYLANRPAKHEDNTPMRRSCVRNIGDLLVNWAGEMRPVTARAYPAFSLQIPSLDYALLRGLAAGKRSSVSIEAEAAIAQFAQNYDGSPVTPISMADQAGTRRALVSPLLVDTEKLSHVSVPGELESELRLGVAFRAAIRSYLEAATQDTVSEVE